MKSWTWDKSWARKEEVGHWTTSLPKLSLQRIHLWLIYSVFCRCLTNFKTRKNCFIPLFKIWCASLQTQHCTNNFVNESMFLYGVKYKESTALLITDLIYGKLLMQNKVSTKLLQQKWNGLTNLLTMCHQNNISEEINFEKLAIYK